MERIARLKQERRAIVLAHYYTRPEVQQAADFVGDSLALAVQAARTDARILLFAGVRFMAETAKVLAPDRKVLIPEPEAGCSLADSCPAERFEAFLREHPGHTVVTYVNTTVGVKALSDLCCTSSNALRIVQSIPEEQPIIFAPDRNLGAYVQRLSGRRNMLLWDGACHVHEEFSPERILALQRAHPGAKLVAHPECRACVARAADFVGSTAALLDFCGSDDARIYIVATEPGILYEMERRYPEKRFIPAPPTDQACGCSECGSMKMITLEKIVQTLEQETPEVTVDEALRVRAERPIRRMIAVR